MDLIEGGSGPVWVDFETYLKSKQVWNRKSFETFWQGKKRNDIQLCFFLATFI